MTRLPIALRVAPYLFYGWAVVTTVFHLVSNWALLDQAADYFSNGADALGVLKYVTQSQVFIGAISDGAYMVANGAVVHVLIGIYDKMKGQTA